MSDIENVINTEQKKKKGRPRKEIQPVVEQEKKKRGRKKKDVVVEEVKQKKKRGRKAAVKFFSSSIRKKIPLTTVIQNSNNYILHLDIKNEENDDQDDINVDSDSDYSNKLDNIVDDIFSNFDAVEKSNEIKKILDEDDFIMNYVNDRNLDEIDEIDLEELYDKRIEYREEQDKLLIEKLEALRHDEGLLDRISEKAQNTNAIKEETRRSNQETNRKKGFFEMFYELSHDKIWLEKTDVACWWCCHTFNTTPIGMPVNYNHNIDKFQVKGLFCSFACMVAYKNDQKIKNNDSLIRFLYRKLTGECIGGKRIPSAPPRAALKMFGGELSIEEFRTSTEENKMYKMIDYPMYISKDYIEEIDIVNVKNANNKIFDDNTLSRVVNLDEKRIQDAKQRLSQIEKTTVTLGNTIDKFIKIT